MKRIARTLLIAALLSASVAQAALEVGGVDFKSHETVGKRSLNLNGAGLRTRLTFKIYAMGLYLGKPATSTTEILQDRGAKRIRIVMIRDLDGKQFAEALLAGLERNHDATTLATLQPSTDALLAAVMSAGTARSGTELTLDQLANGATRLQINDQPAGEDITDPAFYPALLRIWLGEHPADSELKVDLLQQRK
ncbi:MAG TPA: chalcone isomerase family protein [Thauera sp.]|nr:chalcone isomerase family protein [Thauera sp.]HRA81795.1 chalcone isomerase family protein [Thauera sp.]